MPKKKIRIGIELDNVIRDRNRQIAKYYQKDYDESIDLEELDYKDDILNTLCEFKTNEEKLRFVYENYPLEIYGHAQQCERMLMRDINTWILKLFNREDYEYEVFFYSESEYDLTIQSTYFFLSKCGARVREMRFPLDVASLSDMGDVFICSKEDTANELKMRGNGVILIKTNYNKKAFDSADMVCDSLKKFVNDDKSVDHIVEIYNNNLNKEDICKEGIISSIWRRFSTLFKKIQNVT